MSNRSRITVTEQAQGERRKVIGRVLAELGLSALAFALGVGFATGNWPASFAAGLAISSVILVVDIHIDGKQAVIAISAIKVLVYLHATRLEKVPTMACIT
jgi:hypothetical protein